MHIENFPGPLLIGTINQHQGRNRWRATAPDENFRAVDGGEQDASDARVGTVKLREQLIEGNQQAALGQPYDEAAISGLRKTPMTAAMVYQIRTCRLLIFRFHPSGNAQRIPTWAFSTDVFASIELREENKLRPMAFAAAFGPSP